MADKKKNGLLTKVLGPDYDYSAQISSPDELGMSSAGNFDALGRDISGLMAYVKVLVTGRGKGSKTGNPLGSKFFVQTPMKCTDVDSGEKVKRSIYVNNVPDGSVPFISSGGGGVTFDEFRGLVPGLMSNLAQINPIQIINAFSDGSSPTCQAITMETIDEKNIRSSATAYVTNSDIELMNKSWFTINPKPDTTKKTSDEEFSTIHSNSSLINESGTPINYSNMPNDLFIKIYYSSLGLLGFYIFLKMMLRKRLH